jgi:excisionase family DNA binding protein
VLKGLNLRAPLGGKVSQDSEWLSVEQAGAWLGVPADVVRGAVQARVIPAVTIGDYIRLSRSALLGLGAAPAAVQAVTAMPLVAVIEPRSEVAGGLPVPEGLSWVEALTEADEFTIRWPKTGGGGQEELYPQAWRGVVLLNKVKMEAKVGQCIRHDKGRSVIICSEHP